MFFYLQSHSQFVQTSFKMRLHAGHLSSVELRYFPHRPTESVDQDHRHALGLRELCECPSEVRLDDGFMPIVSDKDGSKLSASAATLTYPKEVPGRVADALKLRPVFPRPCQGFGCRFPASFGPENGKKCPTKAGFDSANEVLKLLGARFLQLGHYL